MELKTQINGLNELLKIIYGEEMKLSGLMKLAGFESAQIEQVRDGHLQAIAEKFVEVIHQRLTNDAGKDDYYQILARRYGLDGEPAEPLSAIALRYHDSPEYLRQLFEEIIARVKSKTWQTELLKSLKFIVAAELGQMNQRPAQERVAEKLERLTNLRGAADVTRLDYDAKRAEILKKVQAELDALESEYQPLLEAAEENIAALENEIKTDVLLRGESVSGGAYRAIYSQGRVSWDNDGLTKYAAAHPDVMKFRKQGQPIITLRAANHKN
ncbi:MAG: hypothetical protein Fur002_20120 [Anaerolineales bacterium]